MKMTYTGSKFIKWTFLMLITLSCFPFPSDGLRILGLFPYNSKSHYIVCESLLKALAAKGHRLDVFSYFPQKSPLANFTDHSLAGLIPSNMNAITYDKLLKYKEMSKSLGYWISAIGTPACEHMNLPAFKKLLKSPPQDPPYDLIISNVVLAQCYLAWSRYLNVPMVEIATCTPYDWVLRAHGTPPDPAVEVSMWAEIDVIRSFFDRLVNFFGMVYMIVAYKYYIREQDKYVDKFFGPGYPTVAEMQKDVAMVLANYDHAVHGVRPSVPSIVPVGGMHIKDSNETVPQNLQSWLDESKDGFVYFSFGSMVRMETFPNHILHAFYKTFESIGPIRVLWRIIEPEKLPPNLPKNVLTQKWLPQLQILKHKHIKAFVTHGGILGTYEAIYYAVPMIGVPLYFDQNTNINAYVQKEIAIKVMLNEITVSNFIDAFHDIINNPKYKKNIVKLSETFKDRPMSQIDTAIFWVEYIARHGNNTLKLPSVNMRWWQTSFLDVYCFIVGVIALILFLVTKGLRILNRLIKSQISRRSINKFKIN